MSSQSTTPTKPIPIAGRRRSASESSESSSGDSPTLSPAEDDSPPRIAIRTSPTLTSARLSPSTSPILSYFFANPPPKTPMSVGKTAGHNPQYATVIEDAEDADEPLAIPSAAHARRLSNTWAAGGPKLGQSGQSPIAGDDRSSLLRRLSLGAAFAKPAGSSFASQPPLPRIETQPAVAPLSSPRRPRRATTLAVPSPPKPRAPSPMGERILKGDFHGFL